MNLVVARAERCRLGRCNLEYNKYSLGSGRSSPPCQTSSPLVGLLGIGWTLNPSVAFRREIELEENEGMTEDRGRDVVIYDIEPLS